MDSPIDTSVARLSARRWILGSSMVYEAVNHPQSKPANAIVAWQDGDNTFYLRPSAVSESRGGDVEVDRIHVGGTSAVVGPLGEMHSARSTPGAEGWSWRPT